MSPCCCSPEGTAPTLLRTNKLQSAFREHQAREREKLRDGKIDKETEGVKNKHCRQLKEQTERRGENKHSSQFHLPDCMCCSLIKTKPQLPALLCFQE